MTNLLLTEAGSGCDVLDYEEEISEENSTQLEEVVIITGKITVSP